MESISNRQFFVRLRFGLLTFIELLFLIFDIYFFTSSAPKYGNPIITPDALNDHQ
jgi:hypothetical protein